MDPTGAIIPATIPESPDVGGILGDILPGGEGEDGADSEASLSDDEQGTLGPGGVTIPDPSAASKERATAAATIFGAVMLLL
jgi:hypothetical protein